MAQTSLISEALNALVVRAFGIVLMFASMTLTARLLEPSEYGAYTSAMSLAILLATLAPLGTDRILVRNLSIANSLARSGEETAVTHVCTLLVVGLLLACGVMACGAGVFFMNQQPWIEALVLAGILFVPLTLTYLRQWVAVPLVGTGRAMVPEQTLLPLSFMGAVVIVLLLKIRPTAFLLATTHAACLTVVLGVSVGHAKLKATYAAAIGSIGRITRLELMARTLEGLPFLVASVGSVASQTCTPLLIAASCGLESAACFALAVPYAALPAIPLGVFNLSLLPRCARHFQQREFAAADHAVRSAATITFLAAVVMALATWLCSPLLIALLGTQYAAVCVVLLPLLLAAVVDCSTGPTVPVMQTMAMERFYTRAVLVFLPVQLTIVYASGRMFGVSGAAYGYMLSRVFWNLVIARQIYHVLGLKMWPYLNFRLAFAEASQRGPIKIPLPWITSDNAGSPPMVRAA